MMLTLPLALLGLILLWLSSLAVCGSRGRPHVPGEGV